MSTTDPPAAVADRNAVSLPPPGPLAPPKADMRACAEMQAWLRRLESQDERIGKRNKYLGVALVAALLLLAVALVAVYQATVATYATLSGVRIVQHPADQGRLEISFHVDRPGKVLYRRTSGRIRADMIDYFATPGDATRNWSWTYTPGEDIEAGLWYRRGVLPAQSRQRFPTVARADIVILIDTTASMDRRITELKRRCVDFSRQLSGQDLTHRFALIGFGDTHEKAWLDKHDFTTSAVEFQTWVNRIQRFPGGDLPQSALDALEEALKLPLDEHAMRIFYLATDATYHDPARSGARSADVAAALEKHRVLLNVFCRPEFEPAYRQLLGRDGRYQPIENFGQVLSAGRVLED
jgi:hypothetical protein